ncbi:hypothetical protein T11_6090 [Trichinella zimbabwensis]|uniref:Uncharacterized protein n=1 Tax=Trichinella zimbabwensis TaxID=268475 RepID=A0A0V1GSH7_9BILA|nr:hypothetical protein T11_6090 [Trichinella zimbabwensis]
MSLKHQLSRYPEKEREYADVIQLFLHQCWTEVVHDKGSPIGSTCETPSPSSVLNYDPGRHRKDVFANWPSPSRSGCVLIFVARSISSSSRKVL